MPVSPGRRWISWVFMLIAFLLGLLAVIVVIEDLRGHNRNSTAWTTAINMATGFFSFAGALGYGLRKGWGLPAFGISVPGHVISHGYMIISVINHNRNSVSALVGLSVIPILAGVTLIGMMWEYRNPKTV